MKAIIVIYTNRKITSIKDMGAMKRYTFNTEADLKEGDMVKSPTYLTPLQVVKVLDRPFKYYNQTTGELSDIYTSTNQWVIRTLVIAPEPTDIVYGSLMPL